MDNRLKRLPENIQRLFAMHDQATAAFRAELAGRSAGEVQYDDYLMAQLRKGKSFKVALRKANQKFPTEALEASGESMADTEEHYRFFLRMENIDGSFRQLEGNEREVVRIDGESDSLQRQTQSGNGGSLSPALKTRPAEASLAHGDGPATPAP